LTSPLIIAFDGPAASGKGTLATVIAADYGLPFLDTGLLYRAVGVYAARQPGTDPVTFAKSINIDLLSDLALRTREAGELASQFAADPNVREALKAYQTGFAHQAKGAVLDGRDIGTTIAPKAQVKLFVTAEPETRAHRRWLQLVKDQPDLTLDEILADIRRRDNRDQNRLAAPLTMAQDALLLDTTNLSIEAAIETARRLVKERCDQT
jgi:CMP/dCMP kinase